MNSKVAPEVGHDTVYLTDVRFVGDYRIARSSIIDDDVLSTSTLAIASDLAAPVLLVEVEAWAAKATL